MQPQVGQVASGTRVDAAWITGRFPSVTGQGVPPLSQTLGQKEWHAMRHLKYTLSMTHPHNCNRGDTEQLALPSHTKSTANPTKATTSVPRTRHRWSC
jgi:hypothetical protein